MEDDRSGNRAKEIETMTKRKEEATVKRGPLGEQKGVREDQAEKGIGRAGHLFFFKHRSLLSSTVFVLHFYSLSLYPLSSSPSFLVPC